MYVCVCVPPHSCRTLSSESSAGAGRSGRSSTTSCAPGCLWSPPSYRAERGNHPLYPHLPPLKTKHTLPHQIVWSSLHCVTPDYYIMYSKRHCTCIITNTYIVISACSCVFTSWKDSRVHESGHAEVGKGEQEDHGNVDGNDRGKILWQPRAPG